MKNQVQFQKGYSLAEFLRDYGTEEQCRQALFRWRWPEGYVCPECGGRKYCTLPSRDGLFQCNQCHHQHSLTSRTIFDSSKLPLTTWFLAMHLLAQAKTGLSALALHRQLGVSYNTAWSMKHKLMQVMKEQDDGHTLSGIIQLDDVYWGGERRGGKVGRGSPNKTPFVAAVSTNDEGHPLYMNLQVVKGFRSTEILKWSRNQLAPGSTVYSDGLACFRAVTAAGCQHIPIVTGGGPDSVKHEEFTWVNTMIGNVKNAVTGVYHAMQHKHLPRYLAEYCYRFNRRFDLETLLHRLGRAAARTPPMPYRLLKMAEVYG
ncbi:IS1595 family transposase [Magnetovirga frankeli]|uniref:IS1595 family transposase n=1 Tax=Magnetovirga frankeli TaxID=947516 RepID=UPI0012934A86|nr:IS1595 family transposase [gamma proteobacterium SS-5]